MIFPLTSPNVTSHRKLDYLLAELGLARARRLRVRADVAVAGAVLLAREVVDLERVVAAGGHVLAARRRAAEAREERRATRRPVLHVVLEPPVEGGELAQEGLDERDQLGARHDVLVEQGEALEEVVVDLLGAQRLLQPLEERHFVQGGQLLPVARVRCLRARVAQMGHCFFFFLKHNYKIRYRRVKRDNCEKWT